MLETTGSETEKNNFSHAHMTELTKKINWVLGTPMPDANGDTRGEGTDHRIGQRPHRTAPTSPLGLGKHTHVAVQVEGN